MTITAINKYDRVADGFAERSWANLEFDMGHRFALATGWGAAIDPGDSVLEFGCGDGYLAQLFAQSQRSYHGIDQAPQMVLMAQRRLAQAGLKAEFAVADVQEYSLAAPVDAVVSYMGAFFTFVPDPLSLLRRLRPQVRKKIILDLNPRGRTDLASAIRMLEAAGFDHVTWRPFLVPMSVKLPQAALAVLASMEVVPLLRSLPLRWKFDVLLKGECAGEPHA